MKHLSAFDAVGLLWRKKDRVDEIDTSAYIEETCDSALDCIVHVIAEVEFVRQFGTHCNVGSTSRKWKLFAVSYR